MYRSIPCALGPPRLLRRSHHMDSPHIIAKSHVQTHSSCKSTRSICGSWNAPLPPYEQLAVGAIPSPTIFCPSNVQSVQVLYQCCSNRDSSRASMERSLSNRDTVRDHSPHCDTANLLQLLRTMPILTLSSFVKTNETREARCCYSGANVRHHHRVPTDEYGMAGYWMGR